MSLIHGFVYARLPQKGLLVVGCAGVLVGMANPWQRYKLTIQYLGPLHSGWQVRQSLRSGTVQHAPLTIRCTSRASPRKTTPGRHQVIYISKEKQMALLLQKNATARLPSVQETIEVRVSANPKPVKVEVLRHSHHLQEPCETPLRLINF